MGNATAMNLARDIAVKVSDVIISNADEYGFTYKQKPLDEIENLQAFNAAYGGATALSTGYRAKPTHEANNLYWIALGHWGVTRKNIALIRGSNLGALAGEIETQLKDKKNNMKTKDAEGAKIRYGKCFVCAGIAAYRLVKVPAFVQLGLTMEICKTSGVKHYFMVVGRTPRGEGQTPDPATINDYKNWGADAFIVDLWQGNLNQDYPLWGRTSDGQFGNPSVVDAKDWAYKADFKGGKAVVVAQMSAPFTAELAKAKELKE